MMIGINTVKTIVGYSDAVDLWRKIVSNSIIRDAYGFGYDNGIFSNAAYDEVVRVLGYTAKDQRIWWLLSKMCGVRMRKKSCVCCLRVELIAIVFSLEELVQF
jgi:hypothetical protein